MLIALIVAMSQNRVIGRDGQLPWQLPADLQRFKSITMGQTLLMGRKTWQSIGRPLPGRRTIVLSRDPAFSPSGCTVTADLPSAMAATQTDTLFVCGGAEVYRQTLPLAQRIYLTELLREVEGDVFFPEIPTDEFAIRHTEELLDNGQPCRFTILDRHT